MNQGGVVDQDVAFLFEITADLAEQAGELGRARRAFESAAMQWETLQVLERLVTVRGRLLRLNALN